MKTLFEKIEAYKGTPLTDEEKKEILICVQKDSVNGASLYNQMTRQEQTFSLVSVMKACLEMLEDAVDKRIIREDVKMNANRFKNSLEKSTDAIFRSINAETSLIINDISNCIMYASIVQITD
jgi:hypothetical protein